MTLALSVALKEDTSYWLLIRKTRTFFLNVERFLCSCEKKNILYYDFITSLN